MRRGGAVKPPEGSRRAQLSGVGGAWRATVAGQSRLLGRSMEAPPPFGPVPSKDDEKRKHPLGDLCPLCCVCHRVLLRPKALMQRAQRESLRSGRGTRPLTEICIDFAPLMRGSPKARNYKDQNAERAAIFWACGRGACQEV